MTFPVKVSLQALQCLHDESINEAVITAEMETMHGLHDVVSLIRDDLGTIGAQCLTHQQHRQMLKPHYHTIP